MAEIRIAGTVQDREGGNESSLIDKLKQLPDDFIVICGWSCPTGSRQFGEIDAIVIGRRGLFVLEAKNWMGGITGDTRTWEWISERGTERKHSPIESVIQRRFVVYNYLRDKLYDKPRLYDEINSRFNFWFDEFAVLLNRTADISEIMDDRKTEIIIELQGLDKDLFDSVRRPWWAIDLEFEDIEAIADRIYKPVESPIVGLDFGTTNSLAAYYNENKNVEHIHINERSALVPSLFAIQQDQKMLIGPEVEVELEKLDDPRKRRFSKLNPMNVVFWVKKLIGRTYPEYKNSLEEYPFEIKCGDDSSIQIIVNDKSLSPEEISIEIMKWIKSYAGKRLGEQLNAVIPVPVRFSDRQRRAIEASALTAGFERVFLSIDEATAAALAWLYERNYDYHGTLAIYDLGGGTFDVSIVEIKNGVINVKATRGDNRLGGYHFDLAIADYLLLNSGGKNKHLSEISIQEQYRFRREIEKARKDLSTGTESLVCSNTDVMINLSRDTIKSVTQRLVDKTLDLCKEAIEAAKKNGAGEIDDVILSGGMCYTPFIQDSVKEFFFGSSSAKRPFLPLNPSVLVANGAAIYAGMLMGRVENARVGERVAPFSYGVSSHNMGYPEDNNLYMSVIIERDDKLFDRNGSPQVFRGGSYVTISDNQTKVRFRILQSNIGKKDKILADECISIGTYIVEISPYKEGENGVDVTFRIDSNGILEIEYYELKNSNNRGVKRFNMLIHSGDANTVSAC